MSNWQEIPANGNLNTKNTCVIVRRRNERKGWNVQIAYKDVSGFWRLDGSGFATITSRLFEEWCEIPL